MLIKLKVLMITGVYYPEINGAVLQCRQLINSLSGQILATVLTGTSDKTILRYEVIEQVSVTRIYMPKSEKVKYFLGLTHFMLKAISMVREHDLVHIHGFSRRNGIVIAIARILRKKVVLKMTSYGQDDPLSVKKKFPISWQFYRFCNVFIGVSPGFAVSHKKTNLPENSYVFIPNGVDLKRFSLATSNERSALRNKLGYIENDNIIIFIGHFSKEKRPLLLYQAWLKLMDINIKSKLIFIGQTRGNFEVDEMIVERIKDDAIKRGFLQHLLFVENTTQVHDYLKISDIFVLPSIREGLPNSLLEAMACALPCIVTYIPGVTDWLIQDGKTGSLLYSDEPKTLAELIHNQIKTRSEENLIGLSGRKTVQNNFSSELISKKIFDLYLKMVG